MRPLLFIFLLWTSVLSAEQLSYYHCIDEEGNAYFGEEPPTNCKGEIKTILVDETPATSKDHYYSIKNQAKRFEERRAAETQRRKQEKLEQLQSRLLEQQLKNEEAQAEGRSKAEQDDDSRSVIFVPPRKRVHPRPHRRPRPPEEEEEPAIPPRAYRQ